MQLSLLTPQKMAEIEDFLLLHSLHMPLNLIQFMCVVIVWMDITYRVFQDILQTAQRWMVLGVEKVLVIQVSPANRMQMLMLKTKSEHQATVISTQRIFVPDIDRI